MLFGALRNETLDADEELWRVAQLARSLDVADMIAELPPADALARLQETHHGREVLAALGEHLRRFGGRSRLHELSEPRQAERPELALQSVRLFLEHPRDLPREREAKQRERAELVAATLARIEPETEREGFSELLSQVSAAVELEET